MIERFERQAVTRRPPRGWLAIMFVSMVLSAASLTHASPFPNLSPPPPPSPVPSPSAWKRAVVPDGEAALQVAKQFASLLHNFRLVEAFRLVYGISDPGGEARTCAMTLQEDIATQSWVELAQCEDNILAIASALESYGREIAPGSRSGGRGLYPKNLQALATRPVFLLSAVPQCPSKGKYEYRRTAQGYELCCSADAHFDIGIKGRFPAYAPHVGLTLGNQELLLAPPPHFVVKSLDARLEGYIPDRDACLVRLDEVSSFDVTDPPAPRTSLFVLRRHNGKWLVDLVLSNRDMSLVYDYETWQKTETIPKVLLFYYQLTKTPFSPRPDIARKGQLKVTICKSNLRNISLALERWSVRHRGGYPPDLAAIRSILPQLPRCPAGGVYRYRAQADRSTYTVVCGGHAHADAGLGKDLPCVNPSVGVTEVR